MRFSPRLAVFVLLSALGVALLGVWIFSNDGAVPQPEQAELVKASVPVPPESLGEEEAAPEPRLPGEVLMMEYGSPTTQPEEDLIAVTRVLTGYFSIIKDEHRYPIGGNEDLAARLLGENSSRQAFLPADHPVFGPEGRLVDRWGSPLFVHPLASRSIGLRSAGPDQRLFTEDDLVIQPDGGNR